LNPRRFFWGDDSRDTHGYLMDGRRGLRINHSEWTVREPVKAAPVSQSIGGHMSLIAWIVLGLLAGFIAIKIVNKHGEGFMLDILLGIVGAVVGGVLFRVLGMRGVSGVNLHSLIVAVAGAVVVLVIYHALRRPA
jgi:uncharacterized membrane protein YeaQ/YmgE (transglycosylase-associated protein family)